MLLACPIMRVSLFCICCWSLLAAGPIRSLSAETPITPADLDFFEKKIRPVLVKHCYECHAADAKTVGGKLFLDTRAGMLRGGESGPALIPGNPAESLLLQALRYESFEMPPADPLPEQLIHDFQTWIERGAADPRDGTAPEVAQEGLDSESLWSFYPRRPVAPPAVQRSDWPRETLDHFVLQRLEAEHLAPVGDAAPRTLIIRLFHDLTGLPPTPAEIDAFEQACEQDREQAVTALVDELLQRSQFGEHWGRYWLDVARYGESNGNDGLSRNATFPHAWRYRDYVIDAWNQDVPFNRFLIEQIAGDLLPAETAEQRNRQLIATGFLAIGSKPASAMNSNFAMDIVDDQINAVSTAFLGLSVACARCHDHKHDPISTQDYYAVAGIFKSTESLYGLAANEKLTAPPTRLHELTSQLISPEQLHPDRSAVPQLGEAYQAAVQGLAPTLHARLDVPPEGLQVEPSVTFTSESFAQLKKAHIRGELPDVGESYSVAFWFKNDLDNNSQPITAYLFSRGPFGNKALPGDHIGIGGKHDAARTGKLFVFNGNEEKLKKSAPGDSVIPPGSWNHVVMIRNGARVKLFLNGCAEPEIDAEIPPTFGENREFVFGMRTDQFAPLQGHLADLSLFDRPLSDAEALAVHAASGQPQGVRIQVLGQAMGAAERKEPANCKIHINGDGGKLGPEVPRGVLSAYQQARSTQAAEQHFPLQIEIAAGQSGRLQLAEWIAHPEHPQTARVFVNRVWQQLMGIGLVATPDDFGVYGARPSHPELLDTLAQEFVEQGWSMKQLIRRIVLSRTYQLDSSASPALLEVDPDNRLLARHVRRRLTTEELRDKLLTASGQLESSPKVGSAVAGLDVLLNKADVSVAEFHRDNLHRSIYLCMLRNAPPPELAAFDLPDGVAVAGKRTESVLPGQSLFLMNHPFVLQQAEALAADLLSKPELDLDGRIQAAFRRTLLRESTDSELAISRELLQSIAPAPAQQDVERETSTTTVSLQTKSEHSEAASVPTVASLSPWGAFCQALLLTNEFRYID